MRKIFIIGIAIFILTSANSIDKFTDLMKSHWLVVGPFENPIVNGNCQSFNKDFLIETGGEVKANPVVGQITGNFRWQNYQSTQNYINFFNIFGQKQYCLAYAYNEFLIKSQQKAILKIGSDDGIKIWLNGELIFSHHVHRQLMPDDESILINLKAGTNKILVKVDQGTGDWGFVLSLGSIEDEISDFNKTKINGLKINLVDNIIQNNEINAYVMTSPSFCINENVKIVLYDINNKPLKEKNISIGQYFKFDISGMKSNLYLLQSFGSGKLSGFKSNQEMIYIGDLNKIIEQNIRLARDIAKKNNYPQCDFDIRSTCLFLADQLEGKMHSSLTSSERNLRALFTINEINSFIQNPTLKITGIRQRAYFSNIDESNQPYTVYMPSTYDKNKKYSLLICLHGYTGDDYSAAYNVASCNPQDFIIAGAFGRGDVGYYGIGEQDVLDVIEIMKKNYNVDNDRIYITGISMGGFGTWRFGQIYADYFAGIAPFCGWTNVDYLDNLINTPILIAHGTADDNIPIDMDKNAAAALKYMGYNVRFDALEGVGHNVWTSWIKGADPSKLLDYFRKFKRNPNPLNVDVHTKYLRYGKQYWISIKEFIDPGIAGSLKAKIIDDRHIGITTDNISVFKIDLSHPKLAVNGRIVLNINGYNVLIDAGKSGALLGYSKNKNAYETIKEENNITVPHNGGGIIDLIMKKLYIVYGTKKKNNIKKWQNFAEVLSDFRINEKISFGTKIGKYMVISDKDLISLMESNKEIIKKSNFLLLGSYDENYFIEKINSSLPVKFNGENIEIMKEKYQKAGMILTYPNPLNKENLIGIIMLPYNENQLNDFAVNLNVNLRMYSSSSDITGLVLPDVIIFKSYNVVYATGNFNYNWKNLVIKNMN